LDDYSLLLAEDVDTTPETVGQLKKHVKITIYEITCCIGFLSITLFVLREYNLFFYLILQP